MSGTVHLRRSTSADARALRGLAERDSRAVPAFPLLVAESGGRLLAALSLSSGEAVADPFEPTAHLVAALRAHAAAPPVERRDAWKRERSCAPQPAT
jgi:hypothetical protein